jgi:hypothetical protein
MNILQLKRFLKKSESIICKSIMVRQSGYSTSQNDPKWEWYWVVFVRSLRKNIHSFSGLIIYKVNNWASYLLHQIIPLPIYFQLPVTYLSKHFYPIGFLQQIWTASQIVSVNQYLILDWVQSNKAQYYPTTLLNHCQI